MVHLVSEWAETFMDKNAGYEISVTGGGSGTGIAALLNGTTDICAASRKMKPDELALAKKQNLDLKEIEVALDGIAVVVHPSNPLNEISMEELKGIFTGEIEDWNVVGGPGKKIVVLSRESSSGTYVFFQEHVLQKNDYTAKARLMPATSAIIQAVSEDQAAVGYVGLGYAVEAGKRVKTLKVKADDSSAAITPSENTVKDATYPIARPLQLYVKKDAGEDMDAFIEFVLGKEGQDIAKSTGYVPIN